MLETEAPGTLCLIRNYRCDYVLPPLLFGVHMAMNADLLRRAVMSFT